VVMGKVQVNEHSLNVHWTFPKCALNVP
jgi:hypothetical protein